MDLLGAGRISGLIRAERISGLIGAGRISGLIEGGRISGLIGAGRISGLSEGRGNKWTYWAPGEKVNLLMAGE